MTSDDILDKALVLVRNELGEPLGTAFRILREGIFLTCHHVAVEASEGSLEASDGRVAAVDAIYEDSTNDLATLSCRGLDGTCLALARSLEPETYWTKGYVWSSDALPGALPLRGPLLGNTTEVSYERGGHRYTIRGALVLGDKHQFAPGLSGAPVLDPESFAVVAVAIAAYVGGGPFDGFAVRLRSASNQVGALLARNQKLVPAHGRALNAAGADEACEAQTAGVVLSMEATGRVARARHVVRGDFAAMRAAFVTDSAPILVVTGASGIGKTAELVDIAAATSERSLVSVLIEAASLESPAAHGLASTSLRSANTQVSLAEVARALARANRQLLVCLDGLNEAPAEIQESIAQWIGATVSWLREAGNVKLVASWREEAWEQQADFWPRSDLFQQQPIRLGDFNLEEATAAIATYQLEDARLEPVDVQYPFLARIYSDLASSGQEIDRMSVVDAVDAYLSAKCRTVASRCKGIAARSVRRVLEAMADGMSLDLRIPNDVVLQATSGDIRLSDVIVDEHLLVPVRGGYRFAFDQAGEFLAAREVDVATAADRIIAASHDRTKSAGAYVFALLDLERQGRSQELAVAVARIVEEAGHDIPLWRQGGAYIYQAVWPILRRLDDPDFLIPVLQRWAERLIELGFSVPLATTLRETRLSVDGRLAMLRVLLRDAGAYGARIHDWPEIAQQRLAGDILWQTLEVEILDQPDRVIRLLVQWLEDRSPLFEDTYSAFASRVEPSHRAPQLRDLAFNFLSCHSGLAEDALFDLLAERELEQDRFLWLMAQRRPLDVAARCRRWLSGPDERQHAAAIECAHAILRTYPARSVSSPLIQMLADFLQERGASDFQRRLKRAARLVLAEQPESALGVLDSVVEDLRQGEHSHFWAVSVALALEPERVLPSLFDIARERPEATLKVIGCAEQVRLDPEQERALAVIIRGAIDGGFASWADVCDSLLVRIDQGWGLGSSLIELLDESTINDEEALDIVVDYLLRKGRD